MNKIKADQPTREEWFNKIKSSAEDIKAFITKNSLLEVPEESPAVELMPVLDRERRAGEAHRPEPL